MNKSKFLKKSLAAVLAVLMIVAMIPLSAAAASAPKVYLDSQQIDFAGGASQSVTVDNNTPKLTWDSQAKTKLVAVDAKGNENEVDNSAGIANLPLADYPVADDVYTVTLRLYEESEEGGWQENPAEYTLLVTVKEADVDLDATIKEVTGIPEMVSYSITDDKITIIVAFDESVPTALGSNMAHAAASLIFVPSSKKVDGNNGTGVAYTTATKKLVVTAPNAEKEYDVEIKNQTGFATFSVPDQIGDAEIKGLIEDGTQPTVGVKVKKGTNLTKVVPTFTLGETVEKVTTFKGATADGTGTSEDDDEIDVVSGKTELKFTSGSAKHFNVYLKGKTTPQDVQVTLTEADAAEGAELKSIQVGEKARATVTGKDVTVNMGVNTDYSTPVDVTVEASTDANISIPSQSSVTAQDITNGTATLDDVDISGKKFTLRVTSGDGKTHTDYNITLVPASEVKTDLTDFTIKKGADTYSATFNGMTGTINLPFSMKVANNTRTDWKVYATPSAGATVFDQTDSAIVNGTTTFDSAFATAKGTANNGFIETYEVKVAADDKDLGDEDTTRTYTIKLVFAQPKTGSLALSGTAAVLTKDYTKINENNTLKTEVGTIKDSSDHTTTLNTIKLTVPNSTQNSDETANPALSNAYFSELKLSEGAKAYLVNEDDDGLVEIKALDKKVLNAQSGINGIALDDTATSGNMDPDIVNSNKELVKAGATKLYVVSEAKVDEATALDADVGDAMDALVTNKSAHCYYVYAVKADAETGKSMKSLSSTVDKNVTAVLSGGKIVITLPYSYVSTNDSLDLDGAKDEGIAFSLNFSLSKLASMANGSVALNTDEGKANNDDATWFFAQWNAGAKDTVAFLSGNDGTNSGIVAQTNLTKEWVVTSEDGANSTKYPVTLKVAPAETGATIKSLKVGNTAATISGSTINLTLPFGTVLNPIKLDITADKMAKVFINGSEYKATNNYSLNSDVTITVTSEDGKTTNVYTLKTKLGERFTDVPANAWFAEYVEKAVDAGIVLGQGNGTFNPYGNITREDFAMMTVRMLGVEVDENATVPFKDEASVSAYAKGAVAYCAANKILNGYEDGNFNPKATITREEAAKILAAALKLDVTGTTTFADNARIQSWAVPYVAACQKAGIFGGDEANRFNPQQKITRAETAKVMVDSLKIK